MEMNYGDCLMCKGTGLAWNEDDWAFTGPGKCKTCGGSGKYPKSIMQAERGFTCPISQKDVEKSLTKL